MNNVLEITGYVNVVERDSAVMQPYKHCVPPMNAPFVERVRAGAFREAILTNHCILFKVDHGRTIGTTQNGVLNLSEDSIGLRAIVRTRDPEVIRTAKARQIKGWSFGFIAPQVEWNRIEPGLFRRTLNRFTLQEVSILIHKKPAYIATSAEIGGCSVMEQRAWAPSGDPVILALKVNGLLMEIKKM